MKIILTDSQGNLLAAVTNWVTANVAAKAIIKRNKWSNLYYSIQFDNGEQVTGSIDLEPRSFHQPYLNCVVTKHLKTWWTNISKLPAPKFGFEQSDIDYCKTLLTYLPQVKI